MADKRIAGMMSPLDVAAKVIDGKWKIRIISHLQKGTMRNSELLKEVEGVSQKMLTQSLRELESAGVVTREVYPEIPPRVEYTLTRAGEKLKPILMMLEQWGEDSLKERE